jgi:hypothetical protein
MSRDRTARTRIRQHLAASGPIVDPSGYATGVLKDAIGYSGTPVAFIQLIAAMDRDGEIQREIRGKRTYRIEGVGVPPTPSVGVVTPVTHPATTAVAVPGQAPIQLDYKLLAQALVRELLASTAAAQELAGATAATVESERLGAERDEYARRLEAARVQLDELLGQPIGSVLRDAAPATD